MKKAPGIRCPCLTATSVAPEVSPVSPFTLGTHYTPLSFLKMKLGGPDEVVLASGGRVPMALASLLDSPPHPLPVLQGSLGNAPCPEALGSSYIHL